MRICSCHSSALDCRGALLSGLWVCTGGIGFTRLSFARGGRNIILGPRENLGSGYADCGDGRMFGTHLLGF